MILFGFLTPVASGNENQTNLVTAGMDLGGSFGHRVAMNSILGYEGEGGRALGTRFPTFRF